MPTRNSASATLPTKTHPSPSPSPNRFKHKNPEAHFKGSRKPLPLKNYTPKNPGTTTVPGFFVFPNRHFIPESTFYRDKIEIPTIEIDRKKWYNRERINPH